MENWRGAYYLSSPEKGGLFEGGGGGGGLYRMKNKVTWRYFQTQGHKNKQCV